jgi:predicted Zn-dependent protease
VYGALSALAPGNARFALGLATARLRSGKAEAALTVLDRALERGDISAPVHLVRGQALARLGREPEAKRALAAYVSARAAEPVTPGAGA